MPAQANSCVKELQVGKGAIFSMLCINSKMWVASERALQVYDIETYGVLKEHPFASFHIVHNEVTNGVFVAVWEGIRIFDEPVRCYRSRGNVALTHSADDGADELIQHFERHEGALPARQQTVGWQPQVAECV